VSALDQLVDELAHRVAAIVLERLRRGDPDMVDQVRSPLGRRRHCAAVRRRLARGEAGAAVVGRAHMLSPEALSEELGRASSRGAPSPTPPAHSVRAELEHELRLARGGRRP
jgi:hypothetical protein